MFPCKLVVQFQLLFILNNHCKSVKVFSGNYSTLLKVCNFVSHLIIPFCEETLLS